MILNNFLCCFELETGGLWLGWIGIIVSSLNLFFNTVFLLFPITIEDRNSSTYFIWLIYENAIIVLQLWSSTCLLNGTKKRDHKKVLTSVIIDIILTIMFVYEMFSSFGAVIGVFLELISIYLILCTYSLYQKLESESNLIINTELTSVRTATSYSMAQTVPQVPQVPQIPQVPQSHDSGDYSQPPSYQECSKFVIANQLPSYKSVIPSAPPNE